MSDVFQTIVVSGDGITLPLLIWRRFLKPMPGLLEDTLDRNPGLADLGPVLPVGTSVTIKIPSEPNETEVQDPIRLW